MSTLGYRSDFLGEDKVFELPTISFEHQGDIVFPDGATEEDGPELKYLNYSVVMNQSTRQDFFSAANADFKKNNGKGRSFRLDGRLEQGEQLGNIYYKDLDGVTNPYDRGHLTRRDAISWGDTKKLANKASRDSCFFPNVTLQHANFNQDEWHALEKAIENTRIDVNDKFNIMCGPVFSPTDRFIMPTPSLEPGRIPAAFWKLIAYVGEASKDLEVSAFLVFQDDESILKKKQVLGNNQIDPFVVYQSSTTLIEELTGLEFPEVAFDNNPMLFYERRLDEHAAVPVEEVVNTPELIQVSTEMGETCGIRFFS